MNPTQDHIQKIKLLKINGIVVEHPFDFTYYEPKKYHKNGSYIHKDIMINVKEFPIHYKIGERLDILIITIDDEEVNLKNQCVDSIEYNNVDKDDSSATLWLNTLYPT